MSFNKHRATIERIAALTGEGVIECLERPEQTLKHFIEQTAPNEREKREQAKELLDIVRMNNYRVFNDE